VLNPCYSLLSHYCVAYSWPLCANMTSSVKPEVRSISQRIIGGQSYGKTCTENCVKIGCVIPEICSQADRQTDTVVPILRFAIGGGGGVMILSLSFSRPRLRAHCHYADTPQYNTTSYTQFYSGHRRCRPTVARQSLKSPQCTN